MVAPILRSWRALTGGNTVRDRDRPTIVACSGGADSTALALALASAGGLAALAHIVHDLRPKAQTHADRDAVRDLAQRLGVPFLEASVRARRAAGNTEAAARRLRYAALARLARQAGLSLVATAHHADDQLETVLMRLIRGAGPRGLSGVQPARPIAPGVRLIRPCLSVTREDLEALCRSCGEPWRTDPTNADTSMTRAALRAEVLPVLRRLASGAATNAARSATRCADAAGFMTRSAVRLRRRATTERRGGIERLDRAMLRRVPPAVIAELFRVLAKDRPGRDRMPASSLAAVSSAVRDRVGGDRAFTIGPLRISLTRDALHVKRYAVRP